MSDSATASDVREVATAVRDLAEATGTLGGAVTRLDEQSAQNERLLTEISTKLAPVAVFFEARNKEHAEAEAHTAESGKRKKATLDEWAAWLTPTRAIGLIASIGALCGLGGPATGLAGKFQSAVDAAWTIYHEPAAETGASKPEAVTAPTAPPVPPEVTP